jgi:hypothetical protein
MKGLSLLLFLQIVVTALFGQNIDQDNLEKYWKYRDHLRKRFMKIGVAKGESIPASLIMPHLQYGEDQQSQGSGSVIQWRDATITLGYYWIVLATEYRLLDQNGQDVNSTLNELYYAMHAFNRLDMTAESYLVGQDMAAEPTPSDLNGFFIRDDVRHEMALNFANDPPIANGPIQPDPGHPNMMRADFDGWENYGDGIVGNEVIRTEPHQGGSESLDQLVTILLGLRFIHELVPNVFVQPTPEDEGFYIRDECREIIQRLVNYLNDTSPNGFGQYSAKEWTILQGEDEIVRNAGYFCVLASYPITEMVKELFDTEYSEMIGEPGEVRLQFKEGDICFDLNGDDPNGLAISFVNFVVSTLRNTLGGVILGPLIGQLNPALTLAFMGQGAVWSLAHCTANISCCEATDGPVIIEIPNSTVQAVWREMELSNFPLYSDFTGWHEIYTSDLTIKLDGIPTTPVIPVLPVPVTGEMTNDVNVHMTLELSVLGDIWGPVYERLCAYNSHMEHIPLLHDILHEGGVATYNDRTKSFYESILTQAPCVGPWADPHSFNSAPEWSSACRLFHPGDRNLGARSGGNPDSEYRGYFPGIDYMLLYNAYHLAYAPELPEYEKTVSCECVDEITGEFELATTLDVVRKFPDYKAKGIPIDSYLAHDLAISTANGVMNVRNDLIICRENPDLPTELVITDGAKLNLFNGNSIVVYDGNKIIIENGAQMDFGIPDPADAMVYAAPTIHLKPQAEFHLIDAQALGHGGLKLIMDAGSRVYLNGSEVVPFGPDDQTVILECNGASLEFINSTFVAAHSGSASSTFSGCALSFDNSSLTIQEEAGGFHQWNLTLSDVTVANGSVIDVMGELTCAVTSCHVNSESQLNILSGGRSVFRVGAELHWNNGSMQLSSEESQLLFAGGTLHIPAGGLFHPTHADLPSGFVEFGGSDSQELFTGANAMFKLVGDGPEDELLRITDWADLWNANFAQGTLHLQDCKVNLYNHGRIWTDMKFYARNVTFSDEGSAGSGDSGNVQVWHSSSCNLYDCLFSEVRLHTVNTKVNVNSSDFSGAGSGYRANQGNFQINNSTFSGCHIESNSLAQASVLNRSVFNSPELTNGYVYSQAPCVTDASLVELRVNECKFQNGREGVIKAGGKLTLKCCHFLDLTSNAVSCFQGHLNMSSSAGAGYNVFQGVGTCIYLDNVQFIDLMKGLNNLSGWSDCCICGTINRKCLNTCDLQQNAEGNYWGSPTNTFPPSLQPLGPYAPGMPQVVIEVYTGIGPALCYQIGENGQSLGCKIHFYDNFVTVASGCGSGTPSLGLRSTFQEDTAWDADQKHTEIPGFFSSSYRTDSLDLSNPILTTPSFANVTLDSALIVAASSMEMFGSDGNDLQSVDLFHEILTSGLNRSNPDIRWKMEWARSHMKTAVENLFIDGELTVEGNEQAFEAPVQRYVDVLNVMTDSVLTEATYKDQFYIELEKGQLFRTIGKSGFARYVYQHLDDCQLDSIEQSALNSWLASVDLELNLLEQYVNEGLSPDSVSYEVDTSGYTEAVQFEQGVYQFGMWILSPNLVNFMTCENAFSYKSLRSTIKCSVYPNPNNGLFYLDMPFTGMLEVDFYNVSGARVYSLMESKTEEALVLDTRGFLQKGLYSAVIRADGLLQIEKIIIH